MNFFCGIGASNEWYFPSYIPALRVLLIPSTTKTVLSQINPVSPFVKSAYKWRLGRVLVSSLKRELWLSLLN